MSDNFRILLCMGSSANEDVAGKLLGDAGIQCRVCADTEELLTEMHAGMGALLIEEECFAHAETALAEMFIELPRWSEPPVILVTAGTTLPSARKLPEYISNVTLLERPVSSVSLLSHLHSALQSRRKQYQMRDLLVNLEQLKDNLEAEVAERTAEAELRRIEAERSNQDLRHFASVVSHDLREPLLVVSRYLNLLQQRYRDNLDKTARDMIDHSISSLERMQSMVKGVLAYSRIGRKELEYKTVDTNKLLHDVRNDLQLAISRSGAVVTQDQLPPVRADRTQLSQLFQNLISNSLKFSEDVPHIHVSARSIPDGWEFSVHDNGIGITPDQQQQVFDIFGRADADGKYPGTGIGLAVCKKIVERHGGILRVESEPGRGSTFFFTLAR